jgi:fructokinase
MSAVYGGVETGGTWCVCALGSSPDEIDAREQFSTSTPDETIDRIAAFFESHRRPRALGVGSFGPVDVHPESPTWGHVTTTPKPGWQDVALAPRLQARLGMPVAFDTDVAAAALAEQRWGAGRGCRSVCYLTVGTGIGAGLVIDGAPWHGLLHPEVGHIRIPHDRQRDPFPGACPAHGDCWEGLASGPAIAGRHGRPPQDLADDDPAWALEADYLALGLLNLVCVASPHRVVIGGGVMQRSALLALVQARLRELVDGYLATPLLGAAISEYLVRPELGDDAGVLGAIALAERSDPDAATYGSTRR